MTECKKMKIMKIDFKASCQFVHLYRLIQNYLIDLSI
jgi:hypothetical protein